MIQQPQDDCARQDKNFTCTSISSQYSDVSLPIKLRPYVSVGDLKTECVGEPIVALRASHNATCSYGCEITITQTICMSIPIEYGATADIGEAVANCKKCPNFSAFQQI